MHLGSQPSDYRAYKDFTDIIVPLKSFHRVAATVDITDVNRLSEEQVGLPVRRELWRSNVFTCSFGHGKMHVALWYGPGPNEIPLCQALCFISQTCFFGGKYCMAVPDALMGKLWNLV